MDNPQYKRFFNCLAYVMEDQLRDLCLRSMNDYIEYLMDVGVSRFKYSIKNYGFYIFALNALN